jgi:hypothetical protein
MSLPKFWKPPTEARCLLKVSGKWVAKRSRKRLQCGAEERGAGVNSQVTVLKVLVSYPDGFAVMEDLKRDMALLATSGRDWADRTRRLAARVPDLDIFSQGLVVRESGGWRITDKGRAVLEFMEERPAAGQAIKAAPAQQSDGAIPPLRLPAERARRRRERQERRCEAAERVRAAAS